MVNPRATAPITELDRSLIFDDAIYDAEQRRIFKHAWLFLAHESEIASSGEYVTRLMGQDPVIVVRSDDGLPRAFLNSCAHRGTQLCRADMGNTTHFRCMYHGWTYDTRGRLSGVPGLRKHYPPSFDRASHGLREVRVASFHGLIFGTWDYSVLPLDEYIGDAGFYIGALMDRPANGFEVVGPPLQWIAESNWKVATENFAHDSLHVATLHATGKELNTYREADKESAAYTVDCGGGHGVYAQKIAGDADKAEFLGYPAELWAEFAGRLDPAQAWWMSRNLTCKGNLFPNLSFINVVHGYWGETDAPPTAGFFLRQVQPLTARRSSVFMWILVPVDAPEEWKRWSQDSLIRTLGVAGSFEPDDLENVACVGYGNRGPIALEETFVYEAGAHLVESREIEGLNLPGRVYEWEVNTEIMQRAFYAAWLDEMGDEIARWRSPA